MCRKCSCKECALKRIEEKRELEKIKRDLLSLKKLLEKNKYLSGR
jgi:hypothetical protein